MFFTCADSRILPALLMQSQPGEIFIERTPGNIAPKYSDHVGGVTASVEFAVMALHVPLIIVCGHTDCGVVKALLEPEQPPECRRCRAGCGTHSLRANACCANIAMLPRKRSCVADAV